EGYQPLSPYTYANAGDYEIKLMVTEPDGGCFNEFSVSLRVEAILPVIDFTATPVSGCRPLKVQFTNQSFSVDPATYFWEFMDSDGVVIGSSTMPNPEFTFYDAGFYSVSLSGKNILGTEAKSTKNNIIEVFSRPTAAFLIRPNKLFIPGGILYTQNLSINATEFHWDFGDGTTSDLYAPEHEYTMTGTYTVELVAVNSNGCTDTLTMQSAVSVMEGGTLRVPNAFTPSLNGPTGGIAGGGTHNDVFKPIIEGATEYQMMIFDRWGNLIFETEDLDKGWDGYDKNGRLLPTGVYVYKMRLKFGNGEYFEKIGDVTLIR
ncbi:MAG: PKD domain-containing protein, partial [Cyclobacteriaceae bacterium]|nr:PKD domain-containing protein [Cyclobacteriaceae bacterium]